MILSKIKKLNCLAVIASLLAGGYSQQAYADDSSQAYNYLKELPKDLYSQEKIIKFYPNLSKKEMNALLVKHFKSRKLSPLNKQIIAYGGSLALAIATLTGIGIFMYKAPNDIIKIKLKDAKGNEENIWPLIKMAIGLSGAPAALAILSSLSAKTYGAISNRFWNKVEDPLESYEIKYIKRKRFLPISMQVQIENKFNAAHKDETKTSLALEISKHLINYPLKSLKPRFDLKDLRHKLADYKKTVVESLVNFAMIQDLKYSGNKDSDKVAGNKDSDEVAGNKDSDKVAGNKDSDKVAGNKDSDKIAGNKDSDEVAGNKDSDKIAGNKDSDKVAGNKDSDKVAGGTGKRIVTFLVGPPGTGKTRAVQQVAESLDLPFATISLDSADVEDLMGRSPDSGSPTPGLILNVITSAKNKQGKTAKNMILLIDEADRFLNDSKLQPFMLRLLDPENKTIRNEFLDADIDTSHLIIIMAGNYEIKDEATRRRLNIIQFDGFEREVKRKIIWESTLKKIFTDMSNNPTRKLTIDDLSKEETAYINNLIDIDKDKGFRTLETILYNFVSYLFLKRFYDPEAEMPDFETQVAAAA